MKPYFYVVFAPASPDVYVHQLFTRPREADTKLFFLPAFFHLAISRASSYPGSEQTLLHV